MLANSSDKNTIIQRNNSKVADKTNITPIFSEHLAHEVKAGVDTFRLSKQDDGLHVRVHLLHKPIVSYPLRCSAKACKITINGRNFI